MTRLRIFLSRLRALVRGRTLDRDLQEQIDAHIAEATDEYLEQGLSPVEARRAALRSFGGVVRTQEAHRDVRSFGWLEDARRDVRYALRSVQRTPGFALVAILTLALASGVATAIFSVVDAALLRPVPYQKPDEIVTIGVGEAFDRRLGPSATDIEGWRAGSGVFARIGMGRLGGSRPVIVDAGTPERLTMGTASEDLLEVFGIVPVLGRGISADDGRPGAEPVVLVSHHYWQTRLDGTRDVLGRSILVDGIRATIVGVVPAGFYPETMVWRPHVVTPVMIAMRGTGADVYARLRPGLGIDAAARELTARLSTPKGKPGQRVWLTSLYTHTTARYGRTIAMLAGAVALIVLIACVNVAGLLLARGATRQPELAIRTSIGASRGRLVRQLLAESAVLAVAGGIAGVILAFLTLDAIVALMPLRLPANVTPAVNLPVMMFALALSLVTSVAFGLAPALKLSRPGHDIPVAAGRLRHGSALTRRGGQVLDRDRSCDGPGAGHRRCADAPEFLEDHGDRCRLRARRGGDHGSGAGRCQSGHTRAVLPCARRQRAPDPGNSCRRGSRSAPTRRQRFILERNRQWTLDVHRPESRHARVFRSDWLAVARRAISDGG